MRIPRLLILNQSTALALRSLQLADLGLVALEGGLELRVELRRLLFLLLSSLKLLSRVVVLALEDILHVLRLDFYFGQLNT